MARRATFKRTPLALGILFAGSAVSMCHAKNIPVRSAPAAERVVQLKAGPGPLQNPMKGWCTYTDAGPINQPYSMVYRYASWKELEPKEGDYRFDAWEKKTWQDPLASGRHIVFRVYLDYPSLTSGVPDWLLAKGVATKAYTDYGGGRSPNYDDPRLVQGLERLISAMGKRYDRNPRVAFVQLGLLGYWGEWHTYPHIDWFAGDATQKRIVEAYHRAFPHKVLMARYAGGPVGKQPWIGFHDDMFPGDTDGPENWEFLPKMRQSGRMENWKTAAVGGEMEPRAADKWLGSGYTTTVAAIKTGHFTWIGPYSPAIEPNTSSEFIAHSQELVRMMGYQFALHELRCRSKVARGQALTLTVNGENQGVAPFYYRWPAQLVLIDSGHRVVEKAPLKTDIRTWLPGRFQFSAALNTTVRPGRYQVALGIIDPLTGLPAIRFANDLPTVQGWTALTDVEIVGPPASLHKTASKDTL